MRDGILVLNKPQNWTSHDCVAICRRVLRLKGVKKIGHGGTLDPMAEGVLPIFIGQATRIMEYLDLDYKTYTCQVQLGLNSDTQDIWGTVLEKRPFDGITEESSGRSRRLIRQSASTANGSTNTLTKAGRTRPESWRSQQPAGSTSGRSPSMRSTWSRGRFALRRSAPREPISGPSARISGKGWAAARS